MKILMLCDFFNENMQYQENLLLKYYIKHNHEVSIISATYESAFDYYSNKHDNKSPAKIYNFGGAKIIKLPYRFNILNRLRWFSNIFNWIKQENPDLIFVHDITPNLLQVVKYIKQNPKCRMIMDYHADYSNSGKNFLSIKILHGLVRRWFLRQAQPYISQLFAVAPSCVTFLHQVYGVPREKIELLPLGADIDRGEEIRSSGARARLRKLYDIADTDFVVFTGGKLEPLKRTEELIKAFKKLPPNGVHLIVIGQTSESNQAYGDMLVQLASGALNIRFTGWLDSDEVYAHLALSDIAVFPASQSILWQLAISMGLPLILGEGGNQDASYLNSENNIIILSEVKSIADELESSINRLRNNPSLYLKMSQGAKHVTQKFLNWDLLVEKTINLS